MPVMPVEPEVNRRVVCGPRTQAAFLADVSERPHVEACGLLIGELHDGSWHVDDAQPLRNTHNSASYFEFDPAELVECDLRWGERIIGAYHSHPGGPPRPSRVDFDNMQSNAASPWVWIILSPYGAVTMGPVESGAWRAVTAAAFRVEGDTVVQFPVELSAEAAGTATSPA